jgi:hypothetical protein
MLRGSSSLRSHLQLANLSLR